MPETDGKKAMTMASGVTPQPLDEETSAEMARLNPHVGSNLPMYPAMPRPRQLSAFDPEWEEDPHFAAQSREAKMSQVTSKKLPSPAVLSDILSELTERQRSQEREITAANGAPGSKGPRSMPVVANATSMTFEGEFEAVRAVVDADIGQRTRTNELTAAMASVVPEPDLVRVNAGTGPQLQLDSVWVSTDTSKPAGGDEALFGAPLLATMGGYRPEAYSEALAKRRVMNLIQKDTAQHGRRRGTGSGRRAERTVVFRSKKDMYEPRPRQQLSAAEETEFLEQQAMDPMDSAVAESSPRNVPGEQSSADSRREERGGTLRAASASPGASVSFDVPYSRERQSGKQTRRHQMPEPEPEAAPAPRLSFAERFGGSQPGAAEAGRVGPASSGLSTGVDHAISKPFGQGNADTESGANGVSRSLEADNGGSDVVGSSARVDSELGDIGTGPYRLNHGTGPYQMSRGPGIRRVSKPHTERFDVRSWADDQRRASNAPTLRHFYSEIRTIH